MANSISPKAFIYQSEYDLISRFVMDYPDIETGGDLFGYWTKEGHPVIHYIIGPGKRTTRTSTSFFQDIDYLKECGAVLNKNFGMQAIGAWHSHHKMGLSKPSSGDVNTMRHTMDTTNFTRFLISISNIVGRSQVSTNCFLFSYDNPQDYTPCSWHILDGKSPHRAILDKREPDFFIGPLGGRDESIINIEIKGEPELREQREIREEPKPMSNGLENPYWKTERGKSYLKVIYEKLKNNNLEFLELPDKTLAFSFVYDNNQYQIRFPEDFPNSSAELVGRFSNNNAIKHFFKGNRKGVQDFLYSLGIFERNRVVVIHSK